MKEIKRKEEMKKARKRNKEGGREKGDIKKEENEKRIMKKREI
jgi:hypothetical protein